MFRLVVRPEAESDIDAAYLWYEEQRVGLGAEFLEEIEAGLERVAANPVIYAHIEGPVRRALLHRFPFGLFYIESGDSISIIAVFHTSRDLESIRRRVG